MYKKNTIFLHCLMPIRVYHVKKQTVTGTLFFLIFDFFIPFHNATTHKVFLTFEDLIDIQKKKSFIPLFNANMDIP